MFASVTNAVSGVKSWLSLRNYLNNLPMRKTSTMHPRRNTFMTVHHLVAKTRNGTRKPSNCLRLWRDRHTAYHLLFNNDTLDEIISKLTQHPCKFTEYVITNKKRYQAYELLFRNKHVSEIIEILKRVRRIKKKLKGV